MNILAASNDSQDIYFVLLTAHSERREVFSDYKISIFKEVAMIIIFLALIVNQVEDWGQLFKWLDVLK